MIDVHLNLPVSSPTVSSPTVSSPTVSSRALFRPGALAHRGSARFAMADAAAAGEMIVADR